MASRDSVEAGVGPDANPGRALSAAEEALEASVAAVPELVRPLVLMKPGLLG